MSMVSNNLFGQMYSASRLNGYAGVQRANQGIMSNLANAGNVPAEKLFQSDKKLQLESLQSMLMAKFSELAEKQSDKLKKENIKKTFNVLA